jgi:hypothetical protein
MKIVALGQGHEDCNQARVRVMPPVLVKAVAAAVKAGPVEVVNVVHARPRTCRSISMV